MMHNNIIFENRQDAGKKLATKLTAYKDKPDVLVLGLPRGGVPVAFEVARAISAPLDVFIVRKLGVPGHEELAMGAIAGNDVLILNETIIKQLYITRGDIEIAAQRESQELKRREQLYRHGRPGYDLRGKEIILVDDGLATGASMRAAAEAINKMGVKSIVMAIPVAARETVDEFVHDYKNVVCYFAPSDFVSVGKWYEDFAQTSDREVEDLLDQAAHFFKAA